MPYPPEIPSNLRRQVEDAAPHLYVASDIKVPATTTLAKMRTEARERVEELQAPIYIAIKLEGKWYQIDVIFPDKYSR